MVMSPRQIGHRLPVLSRWQIHDSQNRWWLHGTSAVRGSRCATRHSLSCLLQCMRVPPSRSDVNSYATANVYYVTFRYPCTWCSRVFSPDLWPPNSPDLNPVDYKIWGVMQQWVYESRINSVDELKQRLHDVRHGVQQHIIDLAVSQCRQRLTACERAHGRQFEHLLWACVTQTWVESQYVRINYCWTLFIKITESCLLLNLRTFRFNNFPR